MAGISIEDQVENVATGLAPVLRDVVGRAARGTEDRHGMPGAGHDPDAHGADPLGPPEGLMRLAIDIRARQANIAEQPIVQSH